MGHDESSASSRWVWVHVAVAALAMAATLPGRTHGLGLFTEPILKSTGLDRQTYGTVNLVATLIGALFCVPAGFLLDRLGPRVVLGLVASLLAGTVMLMSQWEPLTLVPLAAFILLTRGLGQSALSVVSLALIGKSSGRDSRWAVGVYSCLVTMCFMGAFGVLRNVVSANPDAWRAPWFGIGVGVLIAGILGALVVRPSVLRATTSGEAAVPSRTFGEALRTGTFWAFALGTSFYGMVAAGTSLFNESILKERGFAKDIFLNATVVGIPVGLVANLGGGWLSTKVHIGRLFAGALVVFAAALAVFPQIVHEWQVYAYAMTLAAAGGVITVCFFSVWQRTFGPAHLGRIQGAAQLLTVLFSGFGQWLFPAVQARFTEYAPLFPFLAGGSVLLAVFAWVAPLTVAERNAR